MKVLDRLEGGSSASSGQQRYSAWMNTETHESVEPWDAELIRRQRKGTLVRIAREGRLLRAGPGGSLRVDLTWIDESALALVEAAVARGQNIALVYPAPAGDVAVLLAAQILLHSFLIGRPSPSVGVTTADPVGAVRAWFDLVIATFADRVPISDHFPCWRATPEGISPHGRRAFAGVLFGRRCQRWRVDVTIFDHLAGQVDGEADGPVVHIFADPLDPLIEQLTAQGTLIWGWSDSSLALWHHNVDHIIPNAVPFSVAHDRIAAIADGIDVSMVVCHHTEAEQALERLHDDLRTLSAVVGPHPPRHSEIGLRVAWSHTATLAALPCRPSDYDRFAGLPPRAARSTSVFEHEIMAWARTLEADLSEYAAVVASDLADLRAALEKGNPFLSSIARYRRGEEPTLVVLRTRTAARALVAALGADPDSVEFSSLKITWLRGLYRIGTVPRALVVGAPPRSVWHRLDSGMAHELDVLVLGDLEARRSRAALSAVRAARSKWASTENRSRVWRELLGEDPPPPPVDVPYEAPPTAEFAGPTFRGDVDPFSPLGALLKDDDRLLVEDDDAEQVALETDKGNWQALVEAVEIETDHGYLVLPARGEVDVLDDEPVTYTADALEPGMHIVIGRQSGRIGLLEALEDRLGHRPDLLAARLLIKDYRQRIYDRFRVSALSMDELYRKLVALGCTKVPLTVRGWVTPGGPMAPRDLPDLRRLNHSLDLGYSEHRVQELSAGLSAIRTFRRLAGKALARSAVEATALEDDARVDPATGLSVADLREAAIVAMVKAVRPIRHPVRLTDTGRLQEERHGNE